jgi:hypothetical protein
MQNFSPWSAWRVTCMTVLYHEFCHRVRFFGTKRAHTFLCSSWPWTVLYAPLSETPCSLRFMHYVLSDTYICTTQSRTFRGVWIAAVNICLLLSNAVNHTKTVYVTLHVIQHTSPKTGHEFPPVRKPSHEKRSRIPLCTSIYDHVSSWPAVLTDLQRNDSLAAPSRGRTTIQRTDIYMPVKWWNPLSGKAVTWGTILPYF